jgi:hypothetical protein
VQHERSCVKKRTRADFLFVCSTAICKMSDICKVCDVSVAASFRNASCFPLSPQRKTCCDPCFLFFQFYASGRCRSGASCKFSHRDESDVSGDGKGSGRAPAAAAGRGSGRPNAKNATSKPPSGPTPSAAPAVTNNSAESSESVPSKPSAWGSASGIPSSVIAMPTAGRAVNARELTNPNHDYPIQIQNNYCTNHRPPVIIRFSRCLSHFGSTLTLKTHPFLF